MPKPPRDNDTNLVQEHYAVVYSPRRARERFPDNCVEIYTDMNAALEASAPEDKRYAAKVIGPSRSSEGFMLYYLDHWLE